MARPQTTVLVLSTLLIAGTHVPTGETVTLDADDAEALEKLKAVEILKAPDTRGEKAATPAGNAPAGGRKKTPNAGKAKK